MHLLDNWLHEHGVCPTVCYKQLIEYVGRLCPVSVAVNQLCMGWLLLCAEWTHMNFGCGWKTIAAWSWTKCRLKTETLHQQITSLFRHKKKCAHKDPRTHMEKKCEQNVHTKHTHTHTHGKEVWTKCAHKTHPHTHTDTWKRSVNKVGTQTPTQRFPRWNKQESRWKPWQKVPTRNKVR